MIQFALFGAGTIGAVHARNILQNPRCGLRWVIDRNKARADALECGGRVSTTIEAALSDSAVDAIIIASSTLAHKEHLSACIAAGKAVLCEKPIADSLIDARSSVEAAKAAGIVAAVGFNRRFDRQHRAVHDRVRAGDIGSVELLHLVSRSAEAPPPEMAHQSGGMIRDKGTHFFDLACWMVGAEPTQAFASGACLFDSGYARFNDVDTAALMLTFETGAMATFSFSRRTTYGYDEMIEVFGSGGMLESRRQPELGVTLHKGRKIVGDGLHAGWYERFEATYRLELDDFVTAVESKTPVQVGLSEGLRAQAIAEAMIASMNERRPIAIDRVW